jgi:hypothetical protein
MHKLRTILFGIILMALAMFLLSFYITGIIAEYKFRAIIANLADLTQQDIKVVEYDLDWFHSDAILKVNIRPYYLLRWQDEHVEAQLGAANAVSPLRQLTFAVHISHGPIILKDHKLKFAQSFINAEVVLSNEQSSVLQRPQHAPPIATMQVNTNLAGSGEATINMDKISFTKGGYSFSWGKLFWQVNFSASLDAMSNKIVFDEQRLITPNAIILIEGLNLDDNYKKISDHLWVGNNHMFFKTFKLAVNPKHNIEINGLDYSAVIDEEKRKVSVKTHLAIDNFMIKGLEYKNFVFDAGASNMNADAVAEVFRQIDFLETMEKPMSLQELNLFEALLSLMNNDAGFDIYKMDVISPWGDFKLAAHAIFKARDTSSVGRILSLLNHTSLEVSVSMHKAVAAQLLRYLAATHKQLVGDVEKIETHPEQVLQQLESSGKIISDEQNYQFFLDYENKKLLINKQAISVE